MMQRITISDIPTPKTRDPRIVCHWFLDSLGLINRDEQGDKMTDIFMLLASKIQANESENAKKTVKIEEIQAHTGLPRSTCYKYISHLMQSGLVKKIAPNEYGLSEGEVGRIFHNIHKDIDKIMEKLKARAEQLDKEMSFV